MSGLEQRRVEIGAAQRRLRSLAIVSAPIRALDNAVRENLKASVSVVGMAAVFLAAKHAHGPFIRLVPSARG